MTLLDRFSCIVFLLLKYWKIYHYSDFRFSCALDHVYKYVFESFSVIQTIEEKAKEFRHCPPV